MVAFSRAMIARPRLLLLDEPALGLAPKLVQHLLGVLQRLVRTGTPVVLVEQNARAALSVSQRGYILHTGRVACAGDREELQRVMIGRAAYLA